MRSSVVALLIGIAGASMLIVGCKPSAEHADAEQTDVQAASHRVEGPLHVSASRLEIRPIQRRIPVVGTLTAWETISVSPKVNGRVFEVRHDVGDRITPGELLLAIDPTDLELAVAEARNALNTQLAKLGLTEPPDEKFDIESMPSVARARFLVENAERKYERLKMLVDKRAAPTQDLEQAQTDLDVEKASLRLARIEVNSILAGIALAQAQLETALSRLADAQVLAPKLTQQDVSGECIKGYVISRRNVAAGEMIGPQSQIFELLVDDVLRLHAKAPERYAGEIRLDQRVELFVDAFPGEAFQARITRIHPIVDAASRTLELEAIVENADHRLKHGGFAKADILTRIDEKAVTAPLDAIVSFAGVDKLFVIRDGKAIDTPVRLGVRGDGWVELLDYDGPLELVATSAASQLYDGALVEIRGPKSEPPTSDAAKEQKPSEKASLDGGESAGAEASSHAPATNPSESTEGQR